MAVRFVDITKATGTLTGTVTFTNAGTAVTGVGTAFLTELAAGNYIKVSTGTEWYRVASITDNLTLTLSWAFAQATVTDAANSTPKNAENGTTVATAFCHLRQATTDEARAAGDIIYCRRGQTHLYQSVDIITDESGTANNYITLMSDDGTGWSAETGLANTKIGFGDAAYQFYWYGRFFWKFKDLDFINSADTSGAIWIYASSGELFESCSFYNNGNRGLKLYWAYGILLKNCSFYNNTSYNATVELSEAKFVDCTFNGTASYGLFLGSSPMVRVENSTFGVTTAHSSGDIYLSRSGRFQGRNVILASPTEVFNITSSDNINAYVKIEDDEQTKLANRAWFYSGTIERVTTPVRAGGASSSARMSPYSTCGTERPLKLCSHLEELSRWLPAGSYTCKMYIYGENWVTFPTANELYLEVLYYDGATAKRASVKSTQVLTANYTWTELSVAFTLNSGSPCYANIFLKKYETDSTHRINVDILPVWSI
uniref:Putative pectate lyase n=1 Tax=viral metagenome TaxID=1070528 RepID=A0A6M3Y1X2_9ZZZZ